MGNRHLACAVVRAIIAAVLVDTQYPFGLTDVEVLKGDVAHAAPTSASGFVFAFVVILGDLVPHPGFDVWAKPGPWKLEG